MLHKHIARHTKRYVSHITKYLYERDTLFATITVFLFLILLGMIPINFYVLNPMKLALKDFDFNDIAYAKLGKGDKEDTTVKYENRIAIINIDDLDRGSIAELITKVSSMKPKIMGLDVFFDGSREPEQDSLLGAVFRNTKNLVVVNREAYDIERHKLFIKPDNFDSVYHHRGFANLDADTIGTVRVYSPFDKVDDQIIPHFTTAVVREYDSVAYHKLEKRHKKQEIINYSRRIDKYRVLTTDQIMQDQVTNDWIEGKIVLFGYISKGPDDIEDKKFTPMNVEFVGKAKPDMNGVVVHANIISMVLDGNYIQKMPKWVAWLVAIVFGWIHMSLFIRYYLESHIWFHLVAKLAQLFSVIFFAYLGIFIFDKFEVKLDMKYTLYVIALAVDVIYFYEAFVGWLHRKYGYQTIFGHHHNPLEHEKHHTNDPHKHETTKHEPTTHEHH
ncbi:MAG TPA: CHASE2 domain-containing protein [Chitinophagaceae bacterium]